MDTDNKRGAGAGGEGRQDRGHENLAQTLIEIDVMEGELTSTFY